MAMRVLLFLALLKVIIGQQSPGQICNNCWEGPCLPICCDCAPDDDTTTSIPMDMTSTISSRLITSTEASVSSTQPPVVTGTTDTPIIESTAAETTNAAIDTTDAAVDTTETAVDTTAAETTDAGPDTTEGADGDICAYWTSSRHQIFGVEGGYPIGVCWGRWGGSDEASESYKYICVDDGNGGKSVKHMRWQTTTDCDDSVDPTPDELPFVFDPTLYPDQDLFNCDGPPCPYYVIQDGSAHKDQRCPYDDGVKFNEGENDYSTWNDRLVLRGCQSFNGLTSQYASCSEEGVGIEIYHFNNGYCDGSIDYTTEAFVTGTIECNYGTGRAVRCFDEDEDEPSTTETPENTAPDDTAATDPSDTSATDPDDTSATDPNDTSATDPNDTSPTDPDDTSPTDPSDDATTTEDLGPQHCGYGGCGPKASQGYKAQFIGACIVAVLVWFRL